MTTTSDVFREMMHGIIILIGSGKMGKSCTGHSIAAHFWPGRPKYILDPYDIDISLFPGYTLIRDTPGIPPGAIIFIEDVNRLFSSRSSNNRSALQQWLSQVSQNDYIVIISTQNFADTDLAWGRSQNTMFIHKMMWSDDIAFERPETALQQVVANMCITEYAEDHPDVDFRSICYGARHGDLTIIEPVSWWIDGKHSHIFRGGADIADVCIITGPALDAAEQTRTASKMPLPQDVALNGDPDNTLSEIDFFVTYGLDDHPAVAGYVNLIKDRAAVLLINRKASYVDQLAHVRGKRSADVTDLRAAADDGTGAEQPAIAAVSEPAKPPQTAETETVMEPVTVCTDGNGYDDGNDVAVPRETPQDRFRYQAIDDEPNRVSKARGFI